MPSATTADKSNSMAPSSAKAMASGSTASAFAIENNGNPGSGNSRGTPPNRLPMVSTGNAKAQAARLATRTAISRPGQFGRSRLSTTISTMLTAAIDIAETFAVGRPCVSATSFGISSPGSLPARAMPKRSLSWLAKMITAMPAVNPTVTG